MPKINQEEYEVLNFLNNTKDWIVRDSDGSLWAYKEEPMKYYGRNNWGFINCGDNDRSQVDVTGLFHFIQWEDENPYNVAELIKEYESSQMTYFDRKLISEYEWLTKESEETEVKKEDLRRSVEQMKTYKFGAYDKHHDKLSKVTSYVKKSAVLHLINQLDEPEKPVELQELIEKYSKDSMSTYDVKVERERFVKDLQNLLVPKQEENNNELYRKFVEIVQMSPASAHDLLNTLANLVAKQHAYGTEKQEITEEQAWEVIHGKYGDELLQNNIDYVESQGYVVIERPTIPQFIADYLPLVKEDIELEKASYYAVTNNELPKWKREYDWIRENFETFARAWLAYPNIKVEKEQKYVVELLYGVLAYHQLDDYWDVFDTGQIEGNEEWVYQLTEQEIKDYDERFWPFAVKVEELEE